MMLVILRTEKNSAEQDIQFFRCFDVTFLLPCFLLTQKIYP